MISRAQAAVSALLWVFVILPACAHNKAFQASEGARVIEGVPFYPQEAHQCGPASLAAVLNYWGVEATPQDIASEIYSSSAKGTLGVDMVLFAQKKGLGAINYEGGLDDMRRRIDSGRPLLVLVDYGFWVYEKAHFMVATGYNDRGVLVNSGSERDKFISYEDFLRAWAKTGFWTLLIRPLDEDGKG